MTNPKPAEIVDAMHAAFRIGDLDAIASYWSDDVEYEAPGVSLRGKPARIFAETVWLNAFSENGVETYARFENGEEIVDFAIMTGRHSGDLVAGSGAPIAPTGAFVSGPYASRYRIKEGKVVYQQVIFDRLALLQSVGAVPA
jgi:ketosteroid isomerase-like protein